MPKHLTHDNVILKALNALGFMMCTVTCHEARANSSSSASQENNHEYRQDGKSAAETDWIKRSRLDATQRTNLKFSCDGGYIDPFADAPTPDPANTLIHVDAGSADMDASYIELGNGVIVTQGPRVIHAGHMMFDKTSERAALSNGVQIRQMGSLIKGQTANVNMVGNEAAFTEGSFLAHQEHMRGKAKLILHEADGKLILEEGKLTSCEPNDNSWALEGKRLTIDPVKKQGYGRDIVIRVGGIPVLYTPYIRFPLGNERQSGLLAPSIGFNLEDGLSEYSQPWYWNIAPNQDATFTPRFIAGRGVMLEAEYRYNGLGNRNVFQLGVLPDDRGGNDPNVDELINNSDLTESDLRPHKGQNRWIIQADHEGGLQQPWYSDIEFGRVSDKDYLRDLPAASFSVANETYLTQSARLGYDLSNWHIAANFYNAQNLLVDIDDVYQRLPQIIADGNYRLGNFGARLTHEYVNFGHRQDVRRNGNTIITGQRVSTDYQFSYQKDTPWGFIKPTLGAQGMGYQLEKRQLRANADNTPALSTHYISLDSGLILEHDSGLQALEPRLFYLFRQYTSHEKLFNVTDDGQSINFDTSPLTFGYHQLYRDHRFAGRDRLDDANQLTLGMTHRAFRTTGKELWDISLGQTFYFDDRRVSLTQEEETLEESDIAGQFTVHINDDIRTLGSAQYNPETDQLMRASMGLHYYSDEWLLNLDYRFAREQPFLTDDDQTQEIDQLDMTFYLPYDNQWQVFGRAFYDLDEQRELETFIGLEYSSCCYKLRAVARRWLDTNLAQSTDSSSKPYDKELYLEFELTGLVSSGKRIHKLLQDSIFGFQKKR